LQVWFEAKAAAREIDEIPGRSETDNKPLSASSAAASDQGSQGKGRIASKSRKRRTIKEALALANLARALATQPKRVEKCETMMLSAQVHEP